jgi:hypothetical protein
VKKLHQPLLQQDVKVPVKGYAWGAVSAVALGAVLSHAQIVAKKVVKDNVQGLAQMNAVEDARAIVIVPA